MLTVLSWIIFVPSTVLNIIVWCLIAHEFLTAKNFSLKGERLYVFFIFLSWFIPGAYLFGVF